LEGLVWIVQTIFFLNTQFEGLTKIITASESESESEHSFINIPTIGTICVVYINLNDLF
jgi:hypothetical protein